MTADEIVRKLAAGKCVYDCMCCFWCGALATYDGPGSDCDTGPFDEPHSDDCVFGQAVAYVGQVGDPAGSCRPDRVGAGQRADRRERSRRRPGDGMSGHEPTILHCRHGDWATCSCGWTGPTRPGRGSARVASADWAVHLRDALKRRFGK